MDVHCGGFQGADDRSDDDARRNGDPAHDKISTWISVPLRAGTSKVRSWKRIFFTISWAC